MNKELIDIFTKFSFLNSHSESSISLLDEDVLSLKKSLKNYLNNTDDDGDSGSNSIVFDDKDFSSLGKSSKIIVFLSRELNNNKKPSQRKKLIQLINQIKESLNKIVKEPKEVEQLITEIKNSDLTPEQEDQIQRKILNYSLFALNKSLDPNFFPTKKVKINTDKLSHLSRQELMQYFDKDVFYNLDRDQVLKLMQAITNEFLSSKGVPTCAIELKNLRLDDKTITYGEYNPNTGAIYFNENILNMFDLAKESKNQFFPYQIVLTLIHEAEHRYQFYCLNKSNQSEKERCVSKSLIAPASSNYAQYLSSADELDSRNAALEYVRAIAIESENEHLAQFYNEKKLQEINNPKNPISQETQEYFPEIYNGELMQTSQPSARAKKKYNELINCYLESENCL